MAKEAVKPGRVRADAVAVRRHVCLTEEARQDPDHGIEMGRVWQCGCGNLWGYCGTNEGSPVWALLLGHVDVFGTS